MAKNDFYKVLLPEGAMLYEVLKFDQDLNFIEQYYITDVGDAGAMVCNCPAGSRSTCRHRKMVRIFQAEERVNTNWFYNFDKKQWYRPKVEV